MMRIGVQGVTVHGDRATVEIEPRRWAGEDPPPVKLVRFGGRWLIDSGGTFEESNYATCVFALDEEFAKDPGSLRTWADATMQEYLDRVCARLADAGKGIEDAAAGKRAAVDVMRQMRAQGRIKLRG